MKLVVDMRSAASSSATRINPPTDQLKITNNPLNMKRYGNPAYRTWFAKMAAEAPGLISKASGWISE
jgi:hypothetical protein